MTERKTKDNKVKVGWIREWLWKNKITGFYTLGDQYGLSEDIICAKLSDFLNKKLKEEETHARKKV